VGVEWEGKVGGGRWESVMGEEGERGVWEWESGSGESGVGMEKVEWEIV
jgi:hypothetical protein